MEEVLAAVIQLVLEVGFQVLASGGLDVASSGRRDQSGCGWLLIHGLLGGLCGWVSTLLFPHLMLPFVWLRLLNLVAAPFLAGVLSLTVLSSLRKGKADEAAAFWHAFTFALLFGLARFAFAHR